MTAAPTGFSAFDHHCMTMALRLARRGLGRVAPNPAVGCVIAKDGVIIGRGWTQPGGRPHAETEALARAGRAARGATAYVTLEPCAHTGKTPPCADALVKAGVARVVSAVSDPDPRVNGKGLEKLRVAGLQVEEGLYSAQAARINRGFVLRVSENRPLITLKLATSLDGRIAARGGASMWITGDQARAEAHALRARHDAIMVGSGTALMDDPMLTCRLPGLAKASPIRVVTDSRLRLGLTSKLVATAEDIPTWLLTAPGNPKERMGALKQTGVEVIEIAASAGNGLDMAAGLQSLAKRGVTRVLVEGGAQLAASLMALGVVDDLVWFRAGMVLGGDGVPAVGALGIGHPQEAARWTLIDRRPLGADAMECYEARERVS